MHYKINLLQLKKKIRKSLDQNTFTIHVYSKYRIKVNVKSVMNSTVPLFHAEIICKLAISQREE